MYGRTFDFVVTALETRDLGHLMPMWDYVEEFDGFADLELVMGLLQELEQAAWWRYADVAENWQYAAPVCSPEEGAYWQELADEALDDYCLASRAWLACRYTRDREQWWTFNPDLDEPVIDDPDEPGHYFYRCPGCGARDCDGCAEPDLEQPYYCSHGVAHLTELDADRCTCGHVEEIPFECGEGEELPF